MRNQKGKKSKPTYGWSKKKRFRANYSNQEMLSAKYSSKDVKRKHVVPKSEFKKNETPINKVVD